MSGITQTYLLEVTLNHFVVHSQKPSTALFFFLKEKYYFEKLSYDYQEQMIDISG